MLASSAKRLEVFGESHEGRAASSYYEPGGRRTFLRIDDSVEKMDSVLRCGHFQCAWGGGETCNACTTFVVCRKFWCVCVSVCAQLGRFHVSLYAFGGHHVSLTVCRGVCCVVRIGDAYVAALDEEPPPPLPCHTKNVFVCSHRALHTPPPRVFRPNRC